MDHRIQDHEDEYFDEVEQVGDRIFIHDGLDNIDDAHSSDAVVHYRRAVFGTSFMPETMDHDLFEPTIEPKMTFAPAVSNAFPESPFFSAPGSIPKLPFQQDTSQQWVRPKLPLLRQKHEVHDPIEEESVQQGTMFTSKEQSNIKLLLNSPPILPAVNYHRVNPYFESMNSPTVIMETLQEALRTNEMEFSLNTSWSIHVTALVSAEELCFSIECAYISAKNTTLRVDFLLLSGDEHHFLGIVSKIRRSCQQLDVNASLALLGLEFDIFDAWSSDEGLFGSSDDFKDQPYNVDDDFDELLFLLQDIIDVNQHPDTRYECAKRLKDVCQVKQNQKALVSDKYRDCFIQCIYAMLQDSDEDVVRFGIYVILNFDNDDSPLLGFEFPQLHETIRKILNDSQKSSTKKLATDLYRSLERSGAYSTVTVS